MNSGIDTATLEYEEKIRETQRQLEELQRGLEERKRAEREKKITEATNLVTTLEEKTKDDHNYLILGVEKVIAKLENTNRNLNELLRIYVDSSNVLSELKRELEYLVNEKERELNALTIEANTNKSASLEREIEQLKYDIDFYRVILEDTIVELSATDSKKDATNGNIKTNIDRMNALRENKLYDMNKKQSDLDKLEEARRILAEASGETYTPNLENTVKIEPVNLDNLAHFEDIYEPIEEPKKAPDLYDAEANKRRIQEIIDSIDQKEEKSSKVTGTLRVAKGLFSNKDEINE